MTSEISRRRFMAGVVAAAAAAACSGSDEASPTQTTTGAAGSTTAAGGATSTASTAPVPDLPADVFKLGVASGDPLSDSVILWTRLAPAPLAGGGMPDEDVPVRWEIAADDTFEPLVASGVATATATFGHSLHVDVTGLEPGTAYRYRFVAGDQTSPVGTTRTAPAPGTSPDSCKFVFASCQNWTAGYWTAWPHAAAEEPDLVLFLGDYIYEGGPGGDTSVRKHNSEEIVSLDDYRNRYGLYRGDPNLQMAHQAAPWIVTWDDHEVENNVAGDFPQDPGDGVDFDARRAAAYQAYYEHHPLRIDPPDADGLQLYRTVDWGDLIRFHVLDGRQYRTDQPCEADVDFSPDCAERTVEGATMLGSEQEAWLGEQFESSVATWNVLANQTIFSPVPLGGALFNMDQWDGYPGARTRLIAQLTESNVSNPVIITGDIHASGVGDVTDVGADDPVVATEFVGTSISSSFPADLVDLARTVIGGLPHVKWFEGAYRGYSTCTVTADEMLVDYRVVDSVITEESGISTIKSWRVAAGTPGAVET